MNPLLIALAILPALVICYAIYRIDKFDKESHWQLIICFVLGMLVTYPAMKLEEIGQNYGLEESTSLLPLLILSYIVVGLSEELTKFLALMFYAYPQKEFNEPLDGIVYAVMIAMGFATLENILYADQYGYQTTIVRAFTAVPAHAVFAVIMGYYVGLAKFNKSKRFSLIAIGLLIPILIHGTYDFFILQEYYDWLMGFATIGIRYYNEMTNMAILTEEVGEVARLMSRMYGEQSFKRKADEATAKEKLADEMADVMFVLVCLANQTGVDLTEALKKNLDKKTKRDTERHANNEKLKDK